MPVSWVPSSSSTRSGSSRSHGGTRPRARGQRAGRGPPRWHRAEERLAYYASRFPLVEVDATYYALPTPRLAELWRRRGPGLQEQLLDSNDAPEESLWQAGASPRGLSGSTLYARFRRYLRDAGLSPTGLHVLRHSAARLRRDAGESVETVSAFLDHSSLAVTTTYLRRLEGVEDHSWRRVAAAMGV